MATDSLWGEIPETPLIRPPVLVLKEQGELLEQLTKGLLNCRIGREQSDSDTVLRFSIVAPALNNYRYVLLTVVHGVELFPADLIDEAEHIRRPCNGEVEFLEALRGVFQSERTKRVIAGLLAQIQLGS